MHGSVFAQATMEKVAYITYVLFRMLLTPKNIERMRKKLTPTGDTATCSDAPGGCQLLIEMVFSIIVFQSSPNVAVGCLKKQHGLRGGSTP
jgi:hypothetical protein